MKSIKIIILLLILVVQTGYINTQAQSNEDYEFNVYLTGFGSFFNRTNGNWVLDFLFCSRYDHNITYNYQDFNTGPFGLRLLANSLNKSDNIRPIYTNPPTLSNLTITPHINFVRSYVEYSHTYIKNINSSLPYGTFTIYRENNSLSKVKINIENISISKQSSSSSYPKLYQVNDFPSEQYNYCYTQSSQPRTDQILLIVFGSSLVVAMVVGIRYLIINKKS